MSQEKGKIIIIKRNGQDRVTFPLMSESCLFGSGLECDIRVQLPNVSDRHCVLRVGAKDKVYLTSFGQENTTLLNNIPVFDQTVPVNHKDILTVVDRCFRFEYPPESAHYVQDDSAIVVPKVKSLKIVSPREKPPLSNVFHLNGTPGKNTSSSKKKLAKKSLEPSEICLFSDDDVSTLSRPTKTYSKKSSPVSRNLLLSAKRKRVSFGPTLSPEQFDKNMPPATPVRRGSLPRRQVTTPDYFGSPIITQYPRPKKNLLSAVPREQSIAEEKFGITKSPPKSSPKSQSPSGSKRKSPNAKASPSEVTQREQSKKSPADRKSPLAKKSPKSVSPKQSSASPSVRNRMKVTDTESELVTVQSDSHGSLPGSPKKTLVNTQKSPVKSLQNSPVRSQQNSPKDKGSPPKLPPLKVWASVVSPSVKQASPLSRRTSSLQSLDNSTSTASTPRLLKSQASDKKGLSTGKKSLKRLSSGRSPARPVSLTTPTRRSPSNIKKKSGSASKSQISHLLTPGSVKNSSITEIQTNDSAIENSLSQASDKKGLSTGKKSLKRLSSGRSPARPVSLTTPTQRSPSNIKKKSGSASKSQISHLLTPGSVKNSSITEIQTNDDSAIENSLSQASDKKGLSTGKKSLKRLSSGRSPARPVSLTTPTPRSPSNIKKKSGSASKSQISHLLTPGSVKNSSITEIQTNDDSAIENSLDTAGNFSDNAYKFARNSDITSQNTVESHLDLKKQSVGKKSSSPRALKQISTCKSPALSRSSTSPGKILEKSRNSAKTQKKNEIPVTEDHLNGMRNTVISQSSSSDQRTPVNSRRSPRANLESLQKQQKSQTKNVPIDIFLTPTSDGRSKFSAALNRSQVTPESGHKLPQSPVIHKSSKKLRSPSGADILLAGMPKSSASKRKADSVLMLEPAKKKLRESPKPGSPSEARHTLQSTPAVTKSRLESPKKSFQKGTTPVPVKSARNSPTVKVTSSGTTPSKSKPNVLTSGKATPKVKSQPSSPKENTRTPSNLSPITSGKATPKVKSQPSSSKEKTRTPSNVSARSKLTPLSARAKFTSDKASSKMKRVSTSVKLKLSTTAEKTAPAKSSTKKISSSSKSVRKIYASSSKSVRKIKIMGKSSEKPLWTEVVRKGIMKKKDSAKPKVVRSLSNAILRKNVSGMSAKNKLLKRSKPTPVKEIALMSTGHANSPETIVIQKKSKSPHPRASRTPLPKETQLLTPVNTSSASSKKAGGSVFSVTSDENSFSSSTTKNSKRKALLHSRKSSLGMSPIATPNITQDRFVSPLTTPRTLRKNNSFLKKYVFESQHVGTPKMTRLSSSKTGRKSETFVGVKRLLSDGSPKADYRNVSGLKRQMQSPRDSPKGDYRDVRGIKRLLKTPKEPKSDYQDVRGVREMFRTPKVSPKADYSDVAGVRNLLKTPASQSQPETINIKQLYQTSPKADYTKVQGVKQLFSSAATEKITTRKTKQKKVVKEQDFSNGGGFKQLFREPEENEFNISGLQQLFSPIPSMSPGSKTDSSTTQEISLAESISSPKSRRKPGFNSPASGNSLSSSKKPVRVASPLQQKSSCENELTAVNGEHLVTSSPKTGVRGNVRTPVGLRGLQTPDSTNKGYPTISSSTTVASPRILQSPLRRKSGGTASPADMLSPKSSESQMKTPAKDVVSPIRSSVKMPSPSIPNVTTPKTRQKTPGRYGKENIRNSQSPKGKRKSFGKEDKFSVETTKDDNAPVEVLNNTSSVTPEHDKRETRHGNVKEIPETTVKGDESAQHEKNDLVVGQQKTRSGKSIASPAKSKVAAKKGSKKSGKQKMADNYEEEGPQPVNRDFIVSDLPAEPTTANEVSSPKGRGRAARSKNKSVDEAVGEQQLQSDSVLPKRGRATRSKNTLAEENTSNSITKLEQKGGRSKKGKKAVSGEIDHQASPGGMSQKGTKTTRGKKALMSEPVESVSPALVKSPPKAGRKTRASKFSAEVTVGVSQITDMKEVTRSKARKEPVSSPVKLLAGVDHEETPEVAKTKGSKRKRGEPKEITKEKTESEANISVDDRLNTKKVNAMASSKKAKNDPSSDLAQNSAGTGPKGRTGNRKKQGDFLNDVSSTPVSSNKKAQPETPGSANQPKTRRNQRLLQLGSADSADALSKGTPETSTATPKGRSKKVVAKASNVVITPVIGESGNDSPRAPDRPKVSRTRRNQKASSGTQVNKTAETSHEVESISAGSRRLKRGHQQDSQTEPAVPSKQSRTRQSQKSVLNSPSSRKGQTVKSEVSQEKTKVPDNKQSEKQSEEDSPSKHIVVKETTVISRRKLTVKSPSQRNAKRGSTTSHVTEASSETENPKRYGKSRSGVSSASSDSVTETSSRPARLKRNVSNAVAEDVPPQKRANKRTTTSKQSSDSVKKGVNVIQVSSKSSKIHCPVLEAIPEVEEVTVAPVASKKNTRSKAAAKQTEKTTPVRRPTRSRRK